MKKKSRGRILSEQFMERIKPIFETWGLRKHPNPTARFGGESNGFWYDFLDDRDPKNLKLVTFAIISNKDSLIIED